MVGARIAAVALAAFGLMTLSVQAHDSTWLKDRRARFSAYQTARPDPGAELARIKAATAAMVAAAPFFDAAAVDREPLIWRVLDKPLELWDGAELPVMVVVPAGEFTMGSSVSEPGRQANEGPRHRVRIAQAFAVSKYPVTVGEFARFVAETGHDAGNNCLTVEGGVWDMRAGRNWRNPAFAQTDDSPAVCVNWNDAQAYAAWLSQKTGHAYRLLTEAEYEYVNRAGSVTSYWWGDDAAAACAHANGGDLDLKAAFAERGVNACHDGFVFTSPVGAYGPNPFGLYDTTGDAWSWLQDCWNDSYAGAPTDGSANLVGDCTKRAHRGGSWRAPPAALRSAWRVGVQADFRGHGDDFRVARTL
jgi:formylglycine-generating enzyme required for sulfatase activity